MVSSVQHQCRYRTLRQLRYINTGTGHLGKFGTTSVPVPGMPVPYRTYPWLAYCCTCVHHSRILRQQSCCTAVYPWRLGGWVDWWKGCGCVRVGVPNRLQDWPRSSGHERNHMGESCCCCFLWLAGYVSGMSEIYKGRFALKAALYHAPSALPCRTRPLLPVRAYFSSRVPQQQYYCCRHAQNGLRHAA